MCNTQFQLENHYIAKYSLVVKLTLRNSKAPPSKISSSSTVLSLVECKIFKNKHFSQIQFMHYVKP